MPAVCGGGAHRGFLIERAGAHGPFLVCATGTEACGFITDKPKNATQRQAYSKRKCPVCQGAMRLRLPKEQGKKVALACCHYPHCQGVRWFNGKGTLEKVRARPETGPPCPECGTPTVKRGPARTGSTSGPARGGASDGSGCRQTGLDHRGAREAGRTTGGLLHQGFVSWHHRRGLPRGGRRVGNPLTSASSEITSCNARRKRDTPEMLRLDTHMKRGWVWPILLAMGLWALHHTCQGCRKRGESMTIRSAQTTIRLSMMNVVHDLSVLVARDEGLFREEGLDVDVIATAGTARATPVGEAHSTPRSSIAVWKRSITGAAWTNIGCVNGA